jgi:DNA-binding transcriptional LysR family regulator
MCIPQLHTQELHAQPLNFMREPGAKRSRSFAPSNAVDISIYARIALRNDFDIRKRHINMHGIAGMKDRRPSFRELEVLHAMIEARKTTSAASKLGISQPAISRTIQQLEARTGKALFRREGGRLVPTPDGILLYQQSLSVFEALARIGRGSLDREVRPVRLIAPPTIAHRFLPQIIAEFLAAEPDIRMQVEIGTTSDVITNVADGRYDFGITDGQVNHPALAFEPFRRAYAHVFLRRDHPLAVKPEITAAELDGQPFIALQRRLQIRTTLERMFMEAGAEPRVVLEAATSAIAYELVRSGLGVTIINPFPVAFRTDPDIVIRPFMPRASYETCFAMPSAAPPPAHARSLMDFIRSRQGEDGYTFPIR